MWPEAVRSPWDSPRNKWPPRLVVIMTTSSDAVMRILELSLPILWALLIRFPLLAV
jgi:hypothetical protein